MNTFEKPLKIVFAIITILYVLEFIFIRGQFTSFIMMILLILISAILAIREAMKKSYVNFGLYLVIIVVVVTQFIRLVG
ncbi:MAG: hypothetical protein ACRCST_09440 [Turicibacter sp.]